MLPESCSKMALLIQTNHKVAEASTARGPQVDLAISNDTRDLVGRSHGLLNPVAPSSHVGEAQSDTERVFQALAGAKILTSQVAMHLSKDWRDRLFGQLDSLHDTSEWERGDSPVAHGSYAT